MDIVQPMIKINNAQAFLTWELGHPSLTPERHLSESVLVTFISMLRFLTEDRVALTEVRFTHPRPENTGEHQRIFQARLVFGQKRNEIVLPESFLDSPILLANPKIMEGLEQLVQRTLYPTYARNSWAIDTFGIRKGVGFGVILTGIFGLSRGLWGDTYTLVMISTIGLAVGQPFILNSITALCAKWFPLEERATATGLAVMAQFVGILFGMDFFRTASGSMTPFLGVLIALSVLNIVFSLKLKESPMIGKTEESSFSTD